MVTRISGKKVLAIVLAGGRGKRLSPLTDERAKPAVPVLGTYKLIDFTLSNLVHSGLHDVWVIVQYMPHGLNEHLSGGRPWDLDRTRGGLRLMPPFADLNNEDGEFSQGNAHALAQHAHLIRHFGADVVLTLSADHIYRLDYSEVIAAHVQSGAEVTMVTTDLRSETEATRFGNVRADAQGRVTEFAYKPEEPLGRTVTAEVFAYDAPTLLKLLPELERSGPLGDYGEELIPALVQRGKAHTFALDGYWLDVGTLDAYLQCHRDFLDGHAPPLDDPEWPFITSSVTRPPTRVERGAVLDTAFVCGGAVVAGRVVRSVIAPNATVEAGAVVRDSVVQPGAVIRRGARVSRAVVDEGAVVGERAVVGGQAPHSRPCVVGARAVLDAGVRIGPGQQVPVGARVRAGQEDRRVEDRDVNDRSGKEG